MGRHIQVAVSRVMQPDCLGGVMVSTLAQNARDVDSIPALSAIFLIFITLPITGAMVRLLYKVHFMCLLNLPCIFICKVISCVYVIESIK